MYYVVHVDNRWINIYRDVFIGIYLVGYFVSQNKWNRIGHLTKLLAKLGNGEYFVFVLHRYIVFDSLNVIFICPGTTSVVIRKSKDYVYGIWVYKALDIWKGYYRVKQSLVSYVKPWTEARNISNITPNLHTNSHFETWAEKWTIMQEASGSSTAPNAARRISC